jgi:hypothetical protein
LSQNVPFDDQDQGTGNTWTGNTCSGGGGNPPSTC